MMRRLFVAVFGVWLGWSCQATLHGQEKTPAAKVPVAPDPKRQPVQQPAPVPLPNPVLAQTIVRKLMESGQLAQYHINVYAHGGNVDLVGEIAEEGQRDTVLRILRTVPGITNVNDWLQVRPAMNVMQAQAAMMQPMMPMQQMQPMMPMQQMQPMMPMQGVMPVQGMMLVQAPVAPVAPQAPERIDGQLPEPQPIFQAPPGPNPTIQAPPMPPYAWPTFAPYNNYSRVAYPNAYPYEQWPFIGPIYPFPKVPLGWRSVSLTWDDGAWWFHRNPTGHDWWRVRYH